ncbi:MAG: extracellular solute-binding protein [Eubacterium sp.]|nr:extracellular solute-binding protein [Eubacterium sp.]
MKLSKKVLCCMLAGAMAVSMATACSNSTGTSSTGGNTSSGGTTDNSNSGTNNENSTDNSEGGNNEGGNGGGTVEIPSNGSVLQWCGYYDLNTQDKELVERFNDAGYTIEYIATTSSEYFVKQSQLISSGDAPDMVSYEWKCYPHGIQQNLYTPLDDYIDLDSALWSGIKTYADDYTYAGKHYYIPYQLRSGVVLIYNATALENEGILTDPWDLYQQGEWTWDTWKQLMVEWCNLGEDYYGVMPTGFVAMPFIVSTGTKMIDVQDNDIINNMQDANVQRCQDFLQDLARQGMVKEKYDGPEAALLDGKTLFTEFGLDWGYSSTQGAMKDQSIRFVPIPRDGAADEYYMNTDTFGYLVPAGAKNVAAALKYMEICRENEIDPERLEYAKKEATAETLYYPKCQECGESYADKTVKDCPNCGAERRVNSTHVAMPEELYDLSIELKNPESDQFVFLFDNCFGFNDDMTTVMQTGNADGEEAVLGGPFLHGDSYTTIRDKYFGAVEGYLNPYREALKNS